MKNYENEIRELINKLNYYTKYYDMGQSLISDKEWDDMYFELQVLENKYGIYYEDSPTQKVNYQVVNKLNKVKHNHPMLSLDKTKSIDVISSFINGKDYIAMAKMDGLTCSLRYLDGKLVSAETRGNGIEGEDILHNALVVKNIPNKINYKEELIVDGEIICTYEDFKLFENEYKHPRNFASGSIRLLDSKESASRHLSFIAWDCIIGLDDFTLLGKLCKLSDLGFTIVPTRRDINNYDIEKLIENIQSDCQSLGYPIDGIVFKYNKCDEYIAVGKTDHHYKGGLAYKFYDEEYETKLIDIEWTMGRTGQLTPVAIYEDIDIDGTICNRASLHNLSIMKEQLYIPYKGEKIWIAKMNMIIPQVVRKEWVANDYDPMINILDVPKVCPICGELTSIHKDNNSEVLFCDNPKCKGKIINQLDHLCGKKGLDIKGLSKATLEKLLDWGWINQARDIFTLKDHISEWQNKPGFGVASVYNILEAIQVAEHTTLDKVIAAAGIPEIGVRVAKDIASHYATWTDFRKENNFMQYDGIGEVMENNLLSFDYNEMDYIVENYLVIQNSKEERKEQKLEGLTFCITGKLVNKDRWKNRDELSAFITSLGGKVIGAVSPNIDYLLNNDINSTSAKNTRAKELGKQIIDEQTFIDMFDL